LIQENIGECTLLSFNLLNKHPIHYHANVKSLKLWSCKFHWTCWPRQGHSLFVRSLNITHPPTWEPFVMLGWQVRVSAQPTANISYYTTFMSSLKVFTWSKHHSNVASILWKQGDISTSHVKWKEDLFNFMQTSHLFGQLFINSEQGALETCQRWPDFWHG